MAYLAERLGFHETDEMSRTRLALIEAMALDSEHVRELAVDYQKQAETLVDAQTDSEARNMRRIGANIAMTLARIESARIDDGIEDLYSVLDDLDGLVVGGRHEATEVVQKVEGLIATLVQDTF